MGAPQPACEHRLDGDLLSERPAQEIGHAGDQPSYIDRLGIERLLAGEGEQPLRQRFRAPCAAHGVLGRAPQPSAVGAVFAQVTLKRFEIADDDGEEIVEVVGDAAGELTDAFHFLRLAKPLVGRAPFGQVARDLGKSDDLALRVPDRVDHDAGPEPASILADPPAFRLVLAGVALRSPSAFLGIPACRSSSV